MTRYAVIGAGAMGGYYGGRLAHAGHEVHFVVRGDYAALRTQGLLLDSMAGQIYLPQVHVHQEPATVPACDVALVCLKTTQQAVLAQYLPRCLSAQGVAVTLQNGLGVEEQLAEHVSAARVFGGVCFLCATRLAPGHIQQRDRDDVHLGQYQAGPPNPRLHSIVDDFCAAGVQAQVAGDLQLARWQKLVWNIPYNGLCALLKHNTTQLQSSAASRELVHALMLEVVHACQAVLGRAPSSGLVEKLLTMTDAFDAYQPSMLLDVLGQRPLELQAIYGCPTQRARACGAPMLRTETLHALLRAQYPALV